MSVLRILPARAHSDDQRPGTSGRGRATSGACDGREHVHSRRHAEREAGHRFTAGGDIPGDGLLEAVERPACAVPGSRFMKGLELWVWPPIGLRSGLGRRSILIKVWRKNLRAWYELGQEHPSLGILAFVLF